VARNAWWKEPTIPDNNEDLEEQDRLVATENRKLDEDIALLTKQLATGPQLTPEALDALEATFAQFAKLTEYSEDRFAACQSTLNDVTGQLAIAQKGTACLDSTITQLRQSNEMNKIELDNLRHTKQNKDQECADLSTQLADLQRKFEELQAKHVEKVTECQQLKAKVAILDPEVNALTSELKMANSHNCEIRDALEDGFDIVISRSDKWATQATMTAITSFANVSQLKQNRINELKNENKEMLEELKKARAIFEAEKQNWITKSDQERSQAIEVNIRLRKALEMMAIETGRPPVPGIEFSLP
jgi:chromosome segregation ATPase